MSALHQESFVLRTPRQIDSAAVLGMILVQTVQMQHRTHSGQPQIDPATRLAPAEHVRHGGEIHEIDSLVARFDLPVMRVPACESCHKRTRSVTIGLNHRARL